MHPYFSLTFETLILFTPQALPEASSLIANRTNKGGSGGISLSTQDSDSESGASQPAPEREQEQTFNALQPPSLIFEHDQSDSLNATPPRRHSRTDSDYNQLLRFIPTAPLTLEPPTPNPEDPPFQARQRFHKAFTLVTRELRERVKHFKEPETPSFDDPFQPAAESGNEGVLEVVSVRSASEPSSPPGGAARNNARELGRLVSTISRSESPMMYEAVEEPSIDQVTPPEEPENVVPPPEEVGLKSPPWLKPLRLVCQVRSVSGGELTHSRASRPSSLVGVVRSFSSHRKYLSKYLSPALTFCHGHNLRYGPRLRTTRGPKRSPKRSLQLHHPLSSLGVGPPRPVEIDLGHQGDQFAPWQQR